MQNTSHNEMKKVVSKLMKDNPKYKENLKDLLSVYLSLLSLERCGALLQK